MNLSQFVLAARARYRVILLILCLTVVAAVAASLALPKIYIANTSLVVNYRGVDSVTGQSLPTQMLPGYIGTQVAIVKSRAVGLSVVDTLKLTENPAALGQLKEASLLEHFQFGPVQAPKAAELRDALADAVLRNIEVVPSRESSVLTIYVKGRDPELIKAIADAAAQGYLDLSVKLKTEPAQRASNLITTQIAALRENYEKAQKELSSYQQSKNMSSTDNRADVESARLNDLSSQLVAVQSQAMEATSRQRQAQTNAAGSPDVVNNGLIQGLKQRLAVAEASFAIIQERLEVNHPQYITAKSELDQIRKSLDDQIRTTSNSVVSNAAILQQRENTLRAALAAQKEKVLSMNGARNELNLLTNEVDNARRAYETASQRFSQTNLEGQSKQTDIALLTGATTPKSPTGPGLAKNVILSVVVGLVLGIAAVLILELLDQRVRSASQLAEALDLPVLGSMVRSQPTKARHAGRSFDRKLGGLGQPIGSAATLERLT
ncbi:MAG: chain length determinant protein EpsF [Pseudomonadota bacterium]